MEGVLRFQDKIYVLDEEELRRQILRSKHNAPVARHQGQAKTLELMTRIFCWPTLYRYVHRYVDRCDLCRRSKPTHHARCRLMQPIPVVHAP